MLELQTAANRVTSSEGYTNQWVSVIFLTRRVRDSHFPHMESERQSFSTQGKWAVVIFHTRKVRDSHFAHNEGMRESFYLYAERVRKIFVLLTRRVRESHFAHIQMELSDDTCTLFTSVSFCGDLLSPSRLPVCLSASHISYILTRCERKYPARYTNTNNWLNCNWQQSKIR